MFDFLKNLIIPRYNNNYFPYLLRRRFLAIVTVVVLALNLATGGGQLGAFAGEISGTRLIELTNQERAAAGLNQLRSDSRLAAAAQAKANNMLQLQYWAHYGPNGETPWQFILAAGYSYVYAGENLAKGFNSSEAVHSAWMASQTHRENILKIGYQDIGIAVVQGNLLGSDVILVVQMFGSTSQAVTPPPVPATPPSTAPPASSPQTVLPEEEKAFVEITSPIDGERIADDKFSMIGKTNLGATSVIVEEGGVEEIGTVGEDGVWDYRPEGNWTEGNHLVSVKDDEKSVSSTVNFEIDTTPPSITKYSFDQGKDSSEGTITLTVRADESASAVILVVGERSMALEQTEGGVYELSVPETDVAGVSVLKIIATDDLGNSTELDLSEGNMGIEENAAEKSEKSQEARTPQQLLSMLIDGDSPHFSRNITRGVVVAVAILLIIDAVYLYRLNIIHSRGKTLFPMALWIIVMAIGIAAGKGGNIL